MRTKLVLPVIGVGILLALALTQVVSAHSRPVRFDPSPGQVLATAPTQVTGWFTSALRRDSNWTFIKVTNEQGAAVTTGDVTLSADRKQMSVALTPNLPPGRYIVNHRTWDDEDNEIVGECFAFYVGQTAADAAVAANFRLDAGANCERVEVSAVQGTPAPGSPLTPAEEEEGHEEGEEANADGDDGGVAPWLLIVTGGLGLVIGIAGTKLVAGMGKG